MGGKKPYIISVKLQVKNQVEKLYIFTIKLVYTIKNWLFHE